MTRNGIGQNGSETGIVAPHPDNIHQRRVFMIF